MLGAGTKAPMLNLRICWSSDDSANFFSGNKNLTLLPLLLLLHKDALLEIGLDDCIALRVLSDDVAVKRSSQEWDRTLLCLRQGRSDPPL